MNAPSPSLRSNPFFFFKFTLLGLALLFGATGCSSGGSSDEDPSGLYQGSATLDGAAPTDLRAFVYGNRIIAFSISEHLLIDGRFTDIDDDEYTARVDVYENGAMSQPNVAVTGLIVEESRITGTLEGTGLADGSFVLTFDTAYNRSSSELIIDSIPDWEGDVLSLVSLFSDTGFDDYVAIEDIGGELRVGLTFISSDNSIRCFFTGDVEVIDSSKNIYELSSVVVDEILAFNPTYCIGAGAVFMDNTKIFSGFVSILSENGADKDIQIALTDGEHSMFGFLSTP